MSDRGVPKGGRDLKVLRHIPYYLSLKHGSDRRLFSSMTFLDQDLFGNSTDTYNPQYIYMYQKVTLPYSGDFVVSPVSRHFPFSMDFAVSPVFRHFPHSWYFAVSPVSIHFPMT